MADVRTDPPAAIIMYSPDTGENETEEWYLYPATWEQELYPEIGVDASGWSPDMDSEPIEGPFPSAAEALEALALIAEVTRG